MVCGFLGIIAATSCHAENLELPAYRYYEQGHFNLAFERWSVEARAGSAKSKYNLAVLKEFGIGTNKDKASALEFYRAAAEQGFAMAQLRMGFFHLNSDALENSYSSAAYWFGLAAKQNNPRAMFRLSQMYAIGKGVGQDLTKAVELYEKADGLDCFLGIESDGFVPSK